jgi:hypothetical protein
LRSQVLSNKAGGALVAGANPHNLKGFLDAFKAILALWTAADGPNAPSLTQCEEFA